MPTILNLLEQAQADESHSSVSRAETDFNNPVEAAKEFVKLKENLQNIDCWNKAGNLSSFEIFDQDGKAVSSGKIAKDLLIRISLKGTGKYDWVKVSEISDAGNEMILTVQPTFDPDNKDKQTVSHFFTAEARNNFCLQLNGTKISFYVIGLNEKQNIAQTNDFVEAIRNWVTANVGSYLGIQKGEWTAFTEKFLHSEEAEN